MREELLGGPRERWRGLARRARWVLVVYVIGFVEGTCAHVLDLARGGIHAYAAFAPVPVQVLFVSLVVLDPLVVVLVGLVRPAGVRLGAGVMALDVLANWIVNWSYMQADPARLLRPVGLLPITLFGLFVLATAVPALRAVHGAATGRGVAPRVLT
ncbi:hypothetical protein K2224_20695 [Streptomyces sp. BHT-5-2]|uniref:hypothetical protein n=1 Tax=unclassified Streptomyces TaxID=2593676 RepID=UPI001C8E30D4|nr:hypothetical protein [Streptomyces sp. BHT-5-2]QZL05256.1 hypothetical protein K2224_20695 [Streptomyces sp. BHT-5-2]